MDEILRYLARWKVCVVERKIASLNETDVVECSAREMPVETVPDGLGECFPSHRFGAKYLPKILPIEWFDDPFLHQSVQRADIGHHACHGIDRPVNRDVAVPVPPLMTVLDGIERISLGDGGRHPDGRLP